MFNDVRSLSKLQFDYLMISLSIIFINTFLIAITTLMYVSLVGAEGLIIKEYLFAAAGLVLILPYIGRFNKKYPIRSLKITICLDFMWLAGYTYVVYDPTAMWTLFISTSLLVVGNFLCRSLNTKVGSSVINGCDDYSNLLTSTSALCTGLSALIGLLVMYYEVSTYIVMFGLVITSLFNRYYKLQVFPVVYPNRK